MPFIRSKRARWVLLVLLASLPLIGWWSYGLFDLDEGFYASVTGSMIRHHEWITPLYNGHPWFEKPILIYWLAKPAVMLFGQSFGPRLPSVLATIATYAVVAWFVRRRIGAMAAVTSLFVLGSSILVVAIGRMIMTDGPLLFFFTAAMLAYGESIVGDPRWKWITAAGLGFAVLAKGPVAIILFVLIAAWTAFSNRGSRISDRQSSIWVWPIGAAILFAIVATWYVPAYLVNGQTFVQEFLIKQNIGRFTGGDSAHTLPFLKSFYFYIPILLAGMFPWILWLPAAVKSRVDPIHRYLFAWAAIIFLFFTISGAKLPHYILPCCPPIAILVGSYFADRWQLLSREQVRSKLLLTLAWLVTCWVIVQVGFSWWYVKSGQMEAHTFARFIADHKDEGRRVVSYQLSRRNKDLGTGKAKILETSLPSLSFYVNEDMEETDDISKIENGPKPAWIFTRKGRIDDSHPIDPLGGQLDSRQNGEYFEVFLVTGPKG